MTMIDDDFPITNARTRKYTRRDYHQLVEAGVLREDDRVELIFGQVVEMSPIDNHHTTSNNLVYRMLYERLRGRAEVLFSSGFAAREDSEPEPDVIVTEPRAPWLHDHPEHALLIVEIARTSLRFDRGEKARLYALSNVDEYWIVDHVHGTIEVRRERREGCWDSIRVYRRGESISPAAFPDVTIAVAEVLPPIE